jgi:hypothetical protein
MFFLVRQIIQNYVFSSVNMQTTEFAFTDAISLLTAIDVMKWTDHMILRLYVI